MPKVYSEAYGCSVSFSDNQIMLGMLSDAGFEVVDNPHDADLSLITTCAVKAPTVNRMIFRIKDISKLGKPLIVSGCMPKTDKDSIEKINSRASLVGPDSVTSIVKVAESALSGQKQIHLEGSDEKANLSHMRVNPVIDIVQINSGCLSNCSFCATKISRGNLRSYRPHLIREQIKKGLKEGCKEFWITSQDSSAYGRDMKTNLAELLQSVSKMEGDFFVRVGMMNPLHFKKLEVENLIEAYKSAKIFKFLHLCVQSGSNKVLGDMRRGYSVEDFLEYVRMFRKEIPELTLETDIIVGFPTETEKDFEETIALVKEARPSLTNVSRYSPRTGTLSSKMKQLDLKLIASRSKEMHALVRKISLEENEKWVGWNGTALVDEIIDGGVIARNFAYKPVAIRDKISLGATVEVEISRAGTYFIGAKTSKDF